MMAHYAFLDENNIVTEVIVGVDEDVVKYNPDGSPIGGTSEAWEQYYSELRNQVCKRTSYNSNIRKNFAEPGFKYDEEKDAFIGPSPWSSWILNQETYKWEAPVPKPPDVDGLQYIWMERLGRWMNEADHDETDH